MEFEGLNRCDVLEYSLEPHCNTFVGDLEDDENNGRYQVVTGSCIANRPIKFSSLANFQNPLSSHSNIGRKSITAWVR